MVADESKISFHFTLQQQISTALALPLREFRILNSFLFARDLALRLGSDYAPKTRRPSESSTRQRSQTSRILFFFCCCCCSYSGRHGGAKSRTKQNTHLHAPERIGDSRRCLCPVCELLQQLRERLFAFEFHSLPPRPLSARGSGNKRTAVKAKALASWASEWPTGRNSYRQTKTETSQRKGKHQPEKNVWTPKRIGISFPDFVLGGSGEPFPFICDDDRWFRESVFARRYLRVRFEAPVRRTTSCYFAPPSARN